MKAVLDACVLYPTVLREILLGVADAGLFVPLWSPRILEEWARAAAKLGPEGGAVARAEVALLRARRGGAEVVADAAVSAALHLPDPDDTHVLAVAIAAPAALIISFNLRDFPRHALTPHGVSVQHPDPFLLALWREAPGKVAQAVQSVHAEAERLSDAQLPLRALLKRAGLPRLAKALSADA